MTILEFLLLRGGFTPRQVGLPDQVLESAGSKPISIRAELPRVRMGKAHGDFTFPNYSGRSYHARRLDRLPRSEL